MQPFDPEQEMLSVRRQLGEHGGVAPSVSRSVTYTVTDPALLPEIFQGRRSPEKGGHYLYGRHLNPTVAVLARYLAALEGTAAAACTSSGMSAISAALLQLCHCGDHIVASDTIYGGTHALLDRFLPGLGIGTTFVDTGDLRAVARAMRPETRVVYTETVANPTLRVADIGALARLAHGQGVRLVVDNTFTPLLVSPARLGADIVVCSMTKFVGGASDLLAGALCGPKDFVESLRDLHRGCLLLLGPTLDPRAAFDLIQRLPHLPMRIREHGRRAMAMARRLSEMGVAVGYPGLAGHRHHRRMQRQINRGYGYGGMLTVDCGTRQRADRFLDELQNRQGFGLVAVSLGYYDTLSSCSGATTSSEIPADRQAAIGLSPGLVRMSIGYTGPLETRLVQLEAAVRAVGLA